MTELLGTQIGHIRVVDALGKGGMGEVYVGFDVKLDRKVAVKAIRTGYRLDADAKARLLREARALSRLDHPNICRIYDYLDGDDTDLLVLEFVDGISLRRAIKDGIKTASGLRIAEQIASVLAAAHAENIVHRDLKPDNVMLTPSGDVKVLDFGISRTLDEERLATIRMAHSKPKPDEEKGEKQDGAAAERGDGDDASPSDPSAVQTRFGSIVGTIAYMSPEQARGEQVSSASDMYSFGLVLQELFTGRPPMEPKLPSNVMLAKASWGETVPVAGIDRYLTALIDRLKALAPDARPTAAEAVDRLRSIRGRPRRRVRQLALAMAVAGLAVVAGKYTVDLRRERNLAIAAQAAEARARVEAEQVVSFLTELFAVSDPGEARGSTVTARELLDRGADKIAAELVDQPLTRARLMTTIGVTYRKLGLYEPAATLLEEAVHIREEHLGADDPLLANSLDSLASLYLEQGRYAEAEPLYQRCLEIGSRVHGPSGADIAKSLNNLALVFRRQGRHAEAEPLLERALAIKEEIHGPEHRLVAVSLNNLANLYDEQGRLDEAQTMYERALAINTAVLHPNHPDIAVSLTNLANVYGATGRSTEAERLYRRALLIKETALGANHPEVGRTANNLADLYLKQGKHAQAEPLLERALGIFENAYGPDHLEVAVVVFNLGDVHRNLGRHGVSETELTRAATVFEAAHGPSGPYLPYPIFALAELYRAMGRFAEAAPLYERALAIREGALPPGHPDLVATANGYAELLRATGRAHEAAALEERIGSAK